MRVVIQRVSRAAVRIEDEVVGQIDRGFMILLGIETADGPADVEWLVRKIASLRIFADGEGKMNESLLDIQGEVLIVSQFTLHAKTKKGARPSFIHAAHPDHAIPLYEGFIREMERVIQRPVATGRFGADMSIELVNDGPVTLLIDSQNKE
jgi:D-tyrosyl-tRNA(Tyr) deacylase